MNIRGILVGMVVSIVAMAVVARVEPLRKIVGL